MNRCFDGVNLRLARVFHALALEDVAERVDKSRQYLHKLETGRAIPTDELAAQLAAVLSVETDFFYQQGTPPLNEELYHFRKLLTTRSGIKQVAMAKAEMFRRLVDLLDSLLRLPAVAFPTVERVTTPDDIELAAERCRSEWGLGWGPIANTIRVAERAGVLVTTFRQVSQEVDALSISARRPFIVLNEAKGSACRQRFDMAHELGHFVMHEGVLTGDRKTENEANRFAGAFLMPRAMMAKLFPRPRGTRLDWAGIREFKMHWKVSKAAILYRARQLGLITDEQYTSGLINLKRNGEAIREREDDAIEWERPELVESASQLLQRTKGWDLAAFGKQLLVKTSVLVDILPTLAQSTASPVAPAGAQVLDFSTLRAQRHNLDS